MNERMTLALEGAGAGVLWTAVSFTLLVFTAPFLWIGEALTDLRWHAGLGMLLISIPGFLLLQRRRLSFGVLVGMALMHCLPGVRVFVPTDHEVLTTGDELNFVEVHWGDAPTGGLEELLLTDAADLVVVHGVSPEGRKALEDGVFEWPHTYAWPPILTGAPAPLGPSILVYSRYAIADWNAQGFGESAVLITGNLEGPVLDVPLTIIDLPTVGPGDRAAAREDLLEELDKRYWPDRTVVLCRLGSSDSSPAYASLREATGLSDARQGFGRVATSPVTIGGLALPFFRVPREFVLHGDLVEVRDCSSQMLRAGERDPVTGSVDSDGPERRMVRTHVRVRA